MDTIIFKKFDYIIYTDGACLGNPGPGGWAAIILERNEKKKLSGSEKNTTNNRMELSAIIQAMSSFHKKKNLKIVTDSKYVIDGINLWLKRWKSNDWKTSAKKPVKNKDLWMKLDDLLNEHSVELEWVKGHSGDKFNEEVDSLAREKANSLN